MGLAGLAGGAERSARQRVGFARARQGLVLAVVALLAGGCWAPTTPKRTSLTDTVKLGVALDAGGITRWQADVRSRSSQGTPFTLTAPEAGSVDHVVIDGVPQAGAKRSADVTVHVGGRVDWTATGIVERHVDGVLVRFPLWAGEDGAQRSDPAVAIDVTVALPYRPESVRWDSSLRGGSDLRNASPDATAGTPAATVSVHGLVAASAPSDLVLTFPPEAFPSLPVAPSRLDDRADADAARADRATEHLRSTLRATSQHQQSIALLYWLAVAIEVAIPLLVAALGLWRAAAARRHSAASSRERSDPPDQSSPAVVALLHRGGNDLGAEAIAGTVLDLVARDLLTIESLSSERYLLAPKVGAEQLRPHETAVVDALSGVVDPHGRVAGPPLPLDPDGAWWTGFQRGVLADASAARLVRRRCPPVVFLPAVVALAVTTAPLWARSPVLAAAGWALAAVLCALPFVGGLTLTAAGHRVRGEWQAYGRFLRHDTVLSDLGAPAVIVRGRPFADAAALGAADAAVRALTPQKVVTSPQPKEVQPT